MIRVLRVLRMIRLAIRLVVRRERVRELVVRGVLARAGERREERLVRVARAHRGDGVIVVVVVVVVRRGGSVGVNAVVARFRRGARAGAVPFVSTSAATAATAATAPPLRAELPPAAATGVPALPRTRGGELLLASRLARGRARHPGRPSRRVLVARPMRSEQRPPPPPADRKSRSASCRKKTRFRYPVEPPLERIEQSHHASRLGRRPR